MSTSDLQGAPRTLLVVEDDPDTANLIHLYFSGHPYTVELVARGQDAITHARQRPPDLVLLDINLPDIDGYTVCKELRSSARTSHIPIIFLTERSAQSDRVAGLGAGAQDYVTKPFDLEELRLRVRGLIARSERENLADPRTRLPTGRLIDEQLQRFKGQPGWSALECRIESFRPFVDSNGFVAGDDVLKFTAHLLREEVDESGTPDDFIGHPFNDTFLILTAAANAPALADRLKARFDAEVQTHYSFLDREQGYVLIRDRDGQMAQAPLMTLHVTTRTP
jgi:PleD family two-component response regulator